MGSKLLMTVCTVGALLAAACSKTDPIESTSSSGVIPTAIPLAGRSMTFVSEGSINPRLLNRFRTLQPDATPSAARVELGHTLFFDKRLSRTDEVSCASCHDLSKGGADSTPVSKGVDGREGERNAPSVFNAAGEFAQFWDGRSPNVEEQALVPILEAKEMGMGNGPALVKKLRSIPGYKPLFEAAFPGEPITAVNVGRALGAYERKLTTPGRWDSYLAGDQAALSTKEKEGLRTFLTVGCMVCHTGALVGGNEFERVGSVEEWPNQTDTGRMRVTGDHKDRMTFKVPSLRNVAKTAPYFHDGSVATLREAVRAMGKHQLGIDLTEREIDSITSWLGALSGDADPALVAPPTLP